MTDESISSVPLVEVIDALRADLKAAQVNRDPNHPLMIEAIEIELQTVVTKSAEGHANAKIEVLTAGKWLGLGGLDFDANIKGSWANAATQKIKLKLSAKSLNPETGELDNTQISDTDDY